MTRRLLILGNSHIRALREALAAEPDRWSELDVTTFGFRGAALPDLAAEEDQIVTTGDFASTHLAALNEGQTAIPLSGFDAIVIAGFDYKPLDAISLSRAMVWPGLPSLEGVADLATLRQTYTSHNAARATMEARLMTCDAARLIGLVKSATDTQIFLIGCPRLNHKAKFSDVPRFYGHGKAIKSGDAEMLGQDWEQIARRVSHRLGVRYLPQPKVTITEHILTRRKFMADGIVTLPTVNGPRRVPDMTHANAAHGALYLQRLKSKLAA